MSLDITKQLDTIISGLMNPKSKYTLTSTEIIYLIHQAKPVFLSEPSLIDLNPPINIVGDIHGQFLDLLRLFAMDKMPPSGRYLFLGDYVDRGPQGLEVMALLLALKLRYPTNIYLLRGNHESKDMTEVYGFANEVKSKVNPQIYSEFIELFDTMPFAALIKKSILCVHGGISPLLNSLDQIRQIRRPIQIGESGLISDLVWSDCARDVEEFSESERGRTCKWGIKPVKRFLEANNLQLFVRAHQMAMDGIEYPFSPIRCVVTVFSAPNYAGEFKNKGGFLKIDKAMKISTVVINGNEPYISLSSSQSVSSPHLRKASSRTNLTSSGSSTRTGQSPHATVSPRASMAGRKSLSITSSTHAPKARLHK